MHFCVTRYLYLFNVELNSHLCEAEMAYVLNTPSGLASNLCPVIGSTQSLLIYGLICIALVVASLSACLTLNYDLPKILVC